MDYNIINVQLWIVQLKITLLERNTFFSKRPVKTFGLNKYQCNLFVTLSDIGDFELHSFYAWGGLGSRGIKVG